MIHPSFLDGYLRNMAHLEDIGVMTYPEEEIYDSYVGEMGIESWKHEYYEWLVQEAMPRRHDPHYVYDARGLLRFLASIPYEWTKELDDNIGYDGMSIRWVYRMISHTEYEGQHQIDTKEDYDRWPPTVLEVLVALGSYAYYQTEAEEPESVWVWRFLDNLGILDVWRSRRRTRRKEIRDILERWMLREYPPSADGYGTPWRFEKLDAPEGFDQMQMWQQMGNYLSAWEGLI